jgi:hypothetical protein
VVSDDPKPDITGKLKVPDIEESMVPGVDNTILPKLPQLSYLTSDMANSSISEPTLFRGITPFHEVSGPVLDICGENPFRGEAQVLCSKNWGEFGSLEANVYEISDSEESHEVSTWWP